MTSQHFVMRLLCGLLLFLVALTGCGTTRKPSSATAEDDTGKKIAASNPAKSTSMKLDLKVPPGSMRIFSPGSDGSDLESAVQKLEIELQELTHVTNVQYYVRPTVKNLGLIWIASSSGRYLQAHSDNGEMHASNQKHD
jgi:hypothetical protein